MKKVLLIALPLSLIVIAILYFYNGNQPLLNEQKTQAKAPIDTAQEQSNKTKIPLTAAQTAKLENKQAPMRDRAKADAEKIIAEKKVKFDYKDSYKYSRYEHRKSIYRIGEMSQQEKDLQALFFNPYWGLEADFANINSAHAGQEPVIDQASEVKYRDSTTTSTLLINFIGSIPITDKASLFAKVGVNTWEIDENQMSAYNDKQRPTYGPYKNQIDKNYGTDMFYGIGFKYNYKDFVLKSEIQIYQLEGEEYEIYSIGGGFRF